MINIFGFPFPITDTGSSDPSNFVNFKGTLFFTARDETPDSDETHGLELWRSDGTPNGTELVLDLNQGVGDSNPTNLIVVGNTLYFTANGTQLWKLEDPAGIPELVTTLPFTFQLPSDFTNVGGTLFFAADNQFFGGDRELWKSNGTADTTVPVADINPSFASSNPEDLINVGDTLFFTADDGSSGRDLWKSDGTTTERVADIVTDPSVGSSPDNLIRLGQFVFFTANDGSGIELWRSDGTEAGTKRVANLGKGAESSTPADLTVMGNTLFFTANVEDHGRELWSVSLVDGEVGKPALVRDLTPGGFVSSDPAELTVVDDTLFFSALTIDKNGERQRSLWKTDGTRNGTVQLGAVSLDPQHLAAARRTLFFTASTAPDGTGGTEIWVSDGTKNGTTPLAEAGLINRQLLVRLLRDEGDGVVTPLDGKAASRNATSRQVASVDLADINAGELIRINIADAVRDALAAGQTRITLSLQLNSPNPVPLTLFSAQDVTHRTGLDVRVAQQDGVLADIYDAQGGLLAQGQSIIDLRTFEAGTYFLQVYNPFAETQKGALRFGIEISPPLPGFSHPLPDHDVIDGGDGDDVVIGNKHVDQLTGDRGDDTFIAEPGEVRDAEPGEDIEEPQQGEKITPSQSGLKRLDVEVEFAEEAVQVAVARALGIPVTAQA